MITKKKQNISRTYIVYEELHIKQNAQISYIPHNNINEKKKEDNEIKLTYSQDLYPNGKIKAIKFYHNDILIIEIICNMSKWLKMEHNKIFFCNTIIGSKGIEEYSEEINNISQYICNTKYSNYNVFSNGKDWLLYR